MMNDLAGKRRASLDGASPDLRAAVQGARLASEEFARWVKVEAPRRKGPSGVGKDHYNWYLKHVLLSPYDFDQQEALLQRELDRSLASLRIEEVRNRAVPPIAEIGDPAAYRRLGEARVDKLYRLLVDAGFIADKPYYRSALAGQWSATPRSPSATSSPTSPRSSRFRCLATDHWIELARLIHEPHPSRSASRPRCSTCSRTVPKAGPRQWRKSSCRRAFTTMCRTAASWCG